MAGALDLEALSKAFSGIGVDEQTMIWVLGNSHPEHRSSFRKENRKFFEGDEKGFDKWDGHSIKFLRTEFLRFKTAVVMWTTHPWERDAWLVKKALKKGPEAYGIIVEVACTRSSEELLGARKAYHSLFDQSMEEDVASHVQGPERKLLVALVSAYRYEGSKVKEDKAESEAEKLAKAIKNDGKNAVEDDEVVRILTTRSKLHLKEVFRNYSEVNQDLGESSILSHTVQCLHSPATYFVKVLEAAFKGDADNWSKKGLTRVVVTRADRADMKEIKEEYQKQTGVPLAKRIEEAAKGNYRDFLLTLLARSD